MSQGGSQSHLRGRIVFQHVDHFGGSSTRTFGSTGGEDVCVGPRQADGERVLLFGDGSTITFWFAIVSVSFRFAGRRTFWLPFDVATSRA